jgi:hypothetical protein
MGEGDAERDRRAEEREADLDRREDALAHRMRAAEDILAAAEQRDTDADARDVGADTRELARDKARFLGTDDAYGSELPGRRDAALDRLHAKGDREASHEDRVALTGEIEDPEVN